MQASTDERCSKQRFVTKAVHGAVHVVEDERRKNASFGMSAKDLAFRYARPDIPTTLASRSWTFASRLLEG
jgi:hypothetical protein